MFLRHLSLRKQAEYLIITVVVAFLVGWAAYLYYAGPHSGASFLSKAGDLDGSGTLTVLDGDRLLEFINGNEEPSIVERRIADLSENGSVAAEDVVLLAQQLSGDVDGSVSVTTSDLQLVYEVIEGKAELSQFQTMVADITGDGLLNRSDLVALSRKVVGDLDRSGSVTVSDLAALKVVQANASISELDLLLGDLDRDGQLTDNDQELLQKVLEPVL